MNINKVPHRVRQIVPGLRSRCSEWMVAKWRRPVGAPGDFQAFDASTENVSPRHVLTLRVTAG